MPDWSYHPIFKPLLFRLSPARARNIALGAMGLLTKAPLGTSVIKFMGHMEPAKELRTEMATIEFQSPIGLSGRLDPNLLGTKPLSTFGFGFIEIGPVTKYPIEESRIERNIDSEDIFYHRLDRNLGLEETYEKLKQLNIKKTKLATRVLYQNNIKDVITILKKLESFTSFYILENVTDPEILKEIRKLYPLKPIFLNVTVYDIDLLSKINEKVIDGIVIDDAIKKENGFSIGKTSKPQCLQFLQDIRLINENIPVIASGGITEPNDAIEFLNHGANMVFVHSGLVYAGPGLPKRINECILQERIKETDTTRSWLPFGFMGLGVFIAGIIAVIFALTEVILPYDEQFLGMTKNRLIEINERIFYFMSHDRMTLAGVMVSAGFLYWQLAYFGVRKRIHWARKVYVIAAVMGFLNFFYFLGFGYIDKLHVLYKIILLPFFLIGYVITRDMKHGDKSINKRNHRAWKRNQVGQLMFVIIGTGLLLAGIVISMIGMSYVFIKEDLVFIGMSADQIKSINHHLVPLIAHDRAGFGGALLSEGFMILTLALWGFREGHRWVWWTLCLGGIPGFVAGIGTHFAIGYTDFFHLSPAYFLFVIYVIGLICSYDYLCKPEKT
ncbi:dihydroorotate dehydrogenase [Bacillus timonensis]|nr:dihydroorotate dehydrogenase [Bacillus timonensis]